MSLVLPDLPQSLSAIMHIPSVPDILRPSAQTADTNSATEALSAEEKIREELGLEWFPRFKDEKMQLRYVLHCNTTSQRVFCRAMVFLLAGWMLFWGPSITHMFPLEDVPQVVRVSAALSQLVLVLLLLVAARTKRFCVHFDTTIVVLGCAFVVTFFLSNSSRMGGLFLNNRYYLYDDPNDISLALSLSLALVIVNQCFRLRASRTWAVPVVTCTSYCLLSFPPGLSPHTFLDNLSAAVILGLISSLTWYGRRHAEIQDMLNYQRTSLLAHTVTMLNGELSALQSMYTSEFANPLEISVRSLSHAIQEEDDGGIATCRKELRDHGWTPCDIEGKVTSLRKSLSEEAGVSVAYLLSAEFEALAQKSTGKLDPTFYDIKNHIFLGEDAVGKDVICPRDGEEGCSLLDTLPKQHRRKATHFLSWLWSYSLSTVRIALQGWVLSENLQPEETFLFMCFFVNNQYRIMRNKNGPVKNGSDDLEGIFEGNLTRIHKMVAILDTWDSPKYLTRIWTIFEQLTAIRLDIPVTMVLPPDAVGQLIQEFESGKEGILRVKDALSSIKCESAKASREADEKKVKELIRKTIGFESVNRQISQFMVEWVACQLQAYMTHLVQTDLPRNTPSVAKVSSIKTCQTTASSPRRRARHSAIHFAIPDQRDEAAPCKNVLFL